MEAAPAPIEPERFYTLGEAARLTGFSRDVLAARCDSGVLPSRRAVGVGSGWRRVSGGDLLAFLRECGVKSQSPRPVANGKPRRTRRAKAVDDFELLKRAGLG